MSDILGLHPINFSNGTEELIAVWSRAAMIRRNSAWILTNGYITANTKCEFESFLDTAFMVNGVDLNQNYNGSDWSKTRNVDNSPIAKYIRKLDVRLYLFNIKIGGTSYPSRCAFPDLPKAGAIKWGLEDGTDLTQTASSKIVTSNSSDFIGKGIKVGDPFTITDGVNRGEYKVQSIDSFRQITLSTALTNSATSSSFWVGGNWFDVQTDDGDIGMGMGVTSSDLILFKKGSVHRFSPRGKELRKVDIDVGTTSPRSIISKGRYVYWFHPSGIYRTQGIQGELISNAIEDVIEGVASGFEVVGWKNEIDDTVNMYLGDVTLRDGDTITKCVASFDENSNVWSLRSYDKAVKVTTNWLHSGAPEVYIGSTNSDVHQWDTGYNFDGASISFELDTKPMFPAGSEAIVDFRRLRAYIENGPDIHILYKLLYRPSGIDGNWYNDKEWKPLRGSQKGDRSEWIFPPESRASGVKFKVIEGSVDKSFLLEKIVLYWSNPVNY